MLQSRQTQRGYDSHSHGAKTYSTTWNLSSTDIAEVRFSVGYAENFLWNFHVVKVDTWVLRENQYAKAGDLFRESHPAQAGLCIVALRAWKLFVLRAI